MRRAVLWLVWIGVAASSWAYEFRDDFSKYQENQSPEPAWQTTGFAWTTQGGRLVAEDPSKAFAFIADAPHGKRVTVEADVTISGTTGKSWKTAGVVVYRDGENYWHLALVQTPDEQQEVKRHVELIEALDGKWLANVGGKGKLAPDGESVDGAWEMGKTYRLRLELSPEGIRGAVKDDGGKVVWSRGFRFSEDVPAVTTGRPGLDDGGFLAAFDNVTASVEETVEPPKSELPPTFPAYSLAPMTDIRSDATGFFRVEKRDGVWWLIDPKGCAFYDVGTDHISYRGHWCQKLGYAPYGKFVETKYDSEDAWAAAQIERLKSWGFNVLAAGHSKSLRHRGLVHTEFISFGSRFSPHSDIAPKTTWTGFPNVFHPRWPSYCLKYARDYCERQKDDPYLLGYFLDNELEWYGKDHTEYGLVNEAFKKPAEHSAKKALLQFLRERYPDIADLNKSWGTSCTSFDQIARATEPPAAQGAGIERDKRDFLGKIAEDYFRYTTEAIRKYDPNHLIIGCRFAGRVQDIVWQAAGKYLDVVSCNYYGRVDLDEGTATPTREKLIEYHELCGKPMMLTEWSHPALDSGLPCEHGAGQRFDTQVQRTKAFEIYQKMLATLPFMVGSHFFMYLDEPALGISDTFPEDTNYGLINEKDEPYPELTAACAALNPRLAGYHAGMTTEAAAELSEDGRKATVTNSGKLPGKCKLDIWEDGALRSLDVDLPPGKVVTVSTLADAAPGAHFVAVEVDPGKTLIEANRGDNVACRQVCLPGESREGRSVVFAVANPTGMTIRNLPVALSLKEAWPQEAPTGARAVGKGNEAVPQQLEQAGDDRVLAILVEELPPRGQAVYHVVADEGVKAIAPEDLTIPFTISNGPLTLRKFEKDGDLVDEVSLNGVVLGQVQAMIHEHVGQNQWLAATDIASVRRTHGPVRDRLDYTVELRPAEAKPTTEVNDQGKFAEREKQPGACRAEYAVEITNGQPIFSLTCSSVTNTDRRSWRLVSYFHYLRSRIGGDPAGDELPMPKVPNYHGIRTVWFDETVGAGYGAIAPAELKAFFWIDKGGNQHPDISRPIDKVLAAGETWASPEPRVHVFGVQGERKSGPWNAVAEVLGARTKVMQTVYR